MAPSGTSCTLSMPPFPTGLQIPDQGLAFSGLLGSQQMFLQNGPGGSLMPGSLGGLRMGADSRPQHSMSMLLSSGGLVHSRVCCPGYGRVCNNEGLLLYVKGWLWCRES